MKQITFIRAHYVVLSAVFIFLLASSLSETVQATALPATASTLPFNPLPYSTLAAKPKKVFAHYHTAYPISLDNRDPGVDYYTKNYLNPLGEGGKYKSVGGLLRNRPIPRYVNPSTAWKLDDMRKEVKLAKAIGLDGFTVNILNYQGVHWERTRLLLQAAQLEGGFKIV
jgi:hypothetical protein